jgi:hypothetical protein
MRLFQSAGLTYSVDFCISYLLLIPMVFLTSICVIRRSGFYDFFIAALQKIIRVFIIFLTLLLNICQQKWFEMKILLNLLNIKLIVSEDSMFSIQ